MMVHFFAYYSKSKGQRSVPAKIDCNLRTEGVIFKEISTCYYVILLYSGSCKPISLINGSERRDKTIIA